jgi:hypothetical protein
MPTPSRMAFVIVAMLVCAPVCGQLYTPARGQAGKDVVWGPTPMALVEAMLDKAAVGPDDTLIDLGSGDGRFVIAAARRGAKAIGVEYNPDLVAFSNRRAAEAGVADRASFVQADLFECDFSQATVLTMYLFTNLNLRLRPKVLAMRPGTRVMSNSFKMGDWEADFIVTAADRTAYGWIVPAQVAGRWTWQQEIGPARLTLTQRYQRIAGTLVINGKALSIRGARLDGDQISFSVGKRSISRTVYSGRADRDGIEGQLTHPDGRTAMWMAARVTNPKE